MFITIKSTDPLLFRSLSVRNSEADIRPFALNVDLNVRVTLRFTPDNPALMHGLGGLGEYVRDTAIVNILNNNWLWKWRCNQSCHAKHVYYRSILKCSAILWLLLLLPQPVDWPKPQQKCVCEAMSVYKKRSIILLLMCIKVHDIFIASA